MLRIAIDGPGGTGKSTIAKEVAKRLGIEYIDTGAMYRAIALKSLTTGTAPDDESGIREMLADTEIDFRGGKIYLDGNDVSGSIRTGEISMRASSVSKLADVRSKVDKLSKHLASTRDVVMEGRDIGTAVIPDAEVKIFMTADARVRAERRYNQLLEAGKEADLESIYNEIQERDYQDSHREINPLKQADDAVYLDTTDMSIKENIEAVLNIAAERTEAESDE